MMLPGMLSGTTQKGKVKTWFDEKGFGFITLDTGNDCYFHRTVCVNQQGFPVNTPVTASIEWDIPKGRYRAVTVTNNEPVAAVGSLAVPGAALGATAPGVAALGAAAPSLNPLGATAATLSPAGSTGATVNGFLSAMGGMNVNALTLIQQTAQQLATQQLAAQQLAAQQAQQLAFGNALANAAFDPGTPTNSSRGGLASDSNIGGPVTVETPSPTLTAKPDLAASMVVPGMMSGTTQNGTVKTWFEDKGFGFLKLDTGNDCYFHRTVCDNQQGYPPGSQVVAHIEWEMDKGRYKAVTVLGTAPSIGASASPGASMSSINAALLANLGLSQAAAPSSTAGAVSPAALLAALTQPKGSGKGPTGENRFLPYGQ